MLNGMAAIMIGGTARKRGNLFQLHGMETTTFRKELRSVSRKKRGFNPPLFKIEC